MRLTLEALEDRTVPSNYSAGNVPELIAAINAANQTPEADTIALVAGRTFTVTEVNNNTSGPTGLPTIAANSGNLTILGNGDTIERSTAAGTPAFRLFTVPGGASLRLENLTLQGGVAVAAGGAIYNWGALTLKAVTVQNNIAMGDWRHGGSSRGTSYTILEPALGGGIYSTLGSLTIENSIIRNNQAIGQNAFWDSINTGDAFGGGLYIDGGSATLTAVTLSSNKAQGGAGYNGGKGGSGFGGGLYAAGGTITLRNSSVTENSALGGAKRGSGLGGGLYIEADALACLDAFTEAHVKRNRPNNIYGSYTICS
ncbi:MAG: hypothetical protein AAB289_09185 [Chloroflexota bacterium]